MINAYEVFSCIKSHPRYIPAFGVEYIERAMRAAAPHIKGVMTFEHYTDQVDVFVTGKRRYKYATLMATVVTPVFVYGTLKRGYWNCDHFLADSTFLAAARTVNSMFLADGGFPIAYTQGQSLHPIAGEVFLVDEQTLRNLDRLEGVPNLYQRITTPVVIEDMRTMDAQMYARTEAPSPRLHGATPVTETGCYMWRP